MRRVLLVLLFLFVNIPSVLAAIAFDASSTGSQVTSASSLTIPHTVSGSQRMLIVFEFTDNDNPVISGVTYNGTALTELESDVRASSAELNVWYVVAPDTGTHDTVISYSTPPGESFAVVVSYTGVAQEEPEVSENQINGNTQSVTTLTDDAWLVGFMGTNNATPTFDGTGETLRQSGNDGDGAGSAGDETTTTAGSYSLEFNRNSAIERISTILSLAPYSAGGGGGGGSSGQVIIY